MSTKKKNTVCFKGQICFTCQCTVKHVKLIVVYKLCVLLALSLELLELLLYGENSFPVIKEQVIQSCGCTNCDGFV